MRRDYKGERAQINANPLCIQEHWRPQGSATEQLEDQRRYAKEYEENWTPVDAKAEHEELMAMAGPEE